MANFGGFSKFFGLYPYFGKSGKSVFVKKLEIGQKMANFRAFLFLYVQSSETSGCAPRGRFFPLWDA